MEELSSVDESHQEYRSLLQESAVGSFSQETDIPLARIKHTSFPPKRISTKKSGLRLKPSVGDSFNQSQQQPNQINKESAPRPGHIQPGRDKVELKKAIYRSSWWLILSQCSIHLIPVGACIVLFVFNFMGLFIGSRLSGPVSVSDDIKLDLFQFIAKAHEVFIVWSISIVVFDTIRHQLLFERGIPLGLIGSGFSFSQIGFFCSSEFWKSVKYRGAFVQKLVLLSVLCLAGLIAATAGPSSAILMIPKNQTWPAGSISFYLNGSTDQLWPVNLTSANAGGPNCLTSNATAYSRCAAGGSKNLYSYFSQLNSLPQSNYFTFNLADDVSMRSIQGNTRNDWQVGSETWAATAHVATTAIEEPLRQAWSFWLRGISIGPNAWRYGYSNLRTVQVHTQFPVVRTACVPNLDLPFDTSTLPFPVLPEFDYWYTHEITNDGQGTYGNGPVYPISVKTAFDTLSNATQNRTVWYKSISSTWIEPSTELGSASAGVLFLFPALESGLSMALSCTVDARWANGTGWAAGATSDWGGAGYIQPMQIYPSYTRAPGFESRLFVPVNNTAWKRIAINSDFFAAMTLWENSTGSSNPLLMTLEDSIPHLINTAYPERYFSNHTANLVPFVEQVLSTFFVDSIARTGSYLQRSSTETLLNLASDPHSTIGLTGPSLEIVASTAANPTTIMRMDTFVQGYSYLLSGFTSFLAIILLMLYCAIALGHTIWILRSGCVSHAWTTISELFLLAQNSEPELDLFENTGVGIVSSRILATKGRIMAVEREERLQLTWEGKENESVLRKRLIVDRCYG